MLTSREASFAVELLDVAALHLVEAARVPHHHHVARLLWRALGVHAALHREAVALSRVALGAGRHHVVPGVLAAAREGLHVVAGQALAAVEGVAGLAAVLAPIVVSGEEDRVRHMSPQAPRYLDVLDQTDHERIRYSALS